MISRFFKRSLQNSSTLVRHLSADQRVLRKETIGDNVINSEYAVRGEINLRGAALQEKMKNGEKLPFKQFFSCNIGNPLLLGQSPLTFNRQVMSVIINYDLLNDPSIHPDIKARARTILDKLPYRGTIGAYSESHGLKSVRKSIKTFLEERDNQTADINNIYLTNGASAACSTIIKMILRGKEDGMMIPIPQYPLYKALIDLYFGTEVPYYLDERQDWGLNMESAVENLKKAKDQGIVVRGMVVINPGNPTGQVLSEENMKEIVKFCYEHKIVLIADEVYQENIYVTDKKWLSFKRVMMEMGAPYNSLELVSLHSTSKGITGECGFRGGYMELNNFDLYIQGQVYKVRSFGLCSNVMGQIMTELMVNPPKEGRESKKIVDYHIKESTEIFNSLKLKASLLSSRLNQMDNITCNEIQGSMYAFPRIEFSDKVIEEAKRIGKEADMLYCLDLLENTGILTVPGSGFKQEEGTYHFRLTNLIWSMKDFLKMVNKLNEFNTQFHQKWAQLIKFVKIL